MAKDIVVLPKSVTPARIASNYIGAVTAAKKLTKEDVETLDGVAAGGKQKRLIMPPWGEWIVMFIGTIFLIVLQLF